MFRWRHSWPRSWPPPAADDKGSWITTLGRDTVAVESVARTGNHVVGDIVVRIPSTVRLHYEVELRPDGSVARSTLDTDPMGAKNIPSTHRHRFRRRLRALDHRLGRTEAQWSRAMPKGTVPMFMTGFGASYGLYSSMGLYELLLERTKPAPNDTLKVPAIDIATGAVSKRAFLSRSATQVDVDYFGILWTHLTVDATGRITGADARATTEQTQSERTAFVDVAAMAKSFASADHSGKGVGPASPNLIEKGTLGGQPVVVTYGSPRRRGRTVLGAVVPYDRVWRTGANEATVLMFDKDMTMAERRCPLVRTACGRFQRRMARCNSSSTNSTGSGAPTTIPRRISCTCQ